jgi:hypothetical protein
MGCAALCAWGGMGGWSWDGIECQLGPEEMRAVVAVGLAGRHLSIHSQRALGAAASALLLVGDTQGDVLPSWG